MPANGIAGDAMQTRASSVLDSTLERLEGADRPLRTTTRMCLIGKLSGGDKEFAQWCENYCRPPAEVTGLLLQLDGGWIMTVEGTTNDILPFLRALAMQLSPDQQVLDPDQPFRVATVKVVSQQEDVRARYYSSWLHHKISVVRSNYAEIEGEAMLTSLLSDTAVSMLKLGKVLQKSPVTVLDRWEENKELADMPSNERIAQLLDMPEIPPLVDFMGIFDAPVDIIMESDRAWPPPHPQPY